MFSAQEFRAGAVRAAQPGWKWALPLVLLMSAAGCTKHPPRQTVVPVRGQVTIAGQPAAGAFVVFHPVDPNDPKTAPAQAYVKDDGSFVLTTYESEDGATPGDYVVTVEWRQLVERDGEFAPGPNVLPKVYGSRETSQIKFNVADAGPIELDPIHLRR